MQNSGGKQVSFNQVAFKKKNPNVGLSLMVGITNFVNIGN